MVQEVVKVATRAVVAERGGFVAEKVEAATGPRCWAGVAEPLGLAGG